MDKEGVSLFENTFDFMFMNTFDSENNVDFMFEDKFECMFCFTFNLTADDLCFENNFGFKIGFNADAEKDLEVNVCDSDPRGVRVQHRVAM